MTETITQKIFEFAYGSGLEDAIRQRAFESYKKPLRQCQEAKQTVKKYIDAILKGETPDFYKTATQVMADFENFKNTYNAQHSGAEKDPHITATFQFGNAQKLINITAKFMFIITYHYPSLRESFAHCHCPLDRVMKDKMFEMMDERKRANTLPQDITDITKFGWKKPFNEAWSSISIDDYKIYQKLIKYLADTAYDKPILPIEFDYLQWQPDLDK